MPPLVPLENLALTPESQTVVEELRQAIASLHEQLTENRELDERFRGEVASAATARAKLEMALSAGGERIERMEQRQARLAQMLSGLALGVAIAMLGLSAPMTIERRTLTVEVALEILLGLAGGGGLAAARRFQKNKGDGYEDRLVAFDDAGFSRSRTGDARGRGAPERGHILVSNSPQPMRATGAHEQGDLDSSGI